VLYGSEFLIIEGGLERVGVDWIQRFSADDYARARPELLVELAAMAQRMARGRVLHHPGRGPLRPLRVLPLRRALPQGAPRQPPPRRAFGPDLRQGRDRGRKVKKAEKEAHA